MSRRAAALVLSVALSAAALSARAAPGEPAPTQAAPQSLAEAERELADLDRRTTELDARVGRLTADIVARDRRSMARARAYARLLRAGLLPLTGGFESFVAHAMKVEGARRSLSTDLSTLSGLRREHAQLVRSRDEAGSRRALVVAQRDAFAQAQSLMEEADDRRRSFERAFTSSREPTEHLAIYGAGVTVHEAAEPAQGFESMRGRLPFPLAGRSEAHASRREGASGPGVEFRPPPGAAVRAVFPGRVAFSARYESYGRLVILDHGGHYYTVYGNLGAVDVKVGDELAAGGRVGAVEEGPAAVLYFEIRRGPDTIDPRPWLGL